MLDRAKFEGIYNESGECDWHTLTALEMRLIRMYRRLSDEDQLRLRRLSEVLLEVPDGPEIDKATS